MKTICLDFDDWSVLNNRLDLLLKLKEAYPKLKVSLFTIPYDVVQETQVNARIMRATTLEAIKKNLDWLEIIPHGLLHLQRELEKCDYETMKKYVIPAIDECFKRDDLPYVKGFKAPYWLWNKDVVKALDEEGWWGAVDRNQPSMLRTKKYYIYGHNINEPFWESTLDVLKLHGHITNQMPDNFEKNFVNLFKMPADAEFKFASELLDDNETT
jgi:hypothetical protein